MTAAEKWPGGNAGAPEGRRRVAVIGAGIAGLSAAWLLRQKYRVTLFEANRYLGGHTNTVDVTLDGATHPVDTGFLVFNERTYPNLIGMFAALGVDSTASDMSFSVSLNEPELEWAGTNLATLFGQKRNVLRGEFWTMLRDILRFNRESVDWLQASGDASLTLREFLLTRRYSNAFADWYLLPMSAAIWSCPTGKMLDMPLATFVRFCRNHGLLQIADRPQWRTVLGGGREYVRKIAAQLSDIRLDCPVAHVVRSEQGLTVTHSNGVNELFDVVVLACHSDQALKILGDNASESQRKILGAVHYQPNRALLHTDSSFLPRNKKLWSAWNYSALQKPAHGDHSPVSVSYLINRLQLLPFKTPVIVTLNPAREPDPTTIIAEFDYEHPLFDHAAIEAQQKLATAQGENGIWLAGAWSGHGFHEDGLRSGIAVANGLGVFAPWQRETVAENAAMLMSW